MAQRIESSFFAVPSETQVTHEQTLLLFNSHQAVLDTDTLHQSNNLWWAAAHIYLPLLITLRFFAVGVTGLVS
jgi:hypothetical protein